MPTVPELQSQLASIQAAITSGATSVSYEGKSVQYRGLAEMLTIQDAILRQLAALGAGPVSVRRTVAAFSSGF